MFSFSSQCRALFFQSPKQSGINWVQMGFREVSNGNTVTFIPISFLSHGGLFPWERKKGKRDKLRDRQGLMIVGAKEPWSAFAIFSVTLIFSGSSAQYTH